MSDPKATRVDKVVACLQDRPFIITVAAFVLTCIHYVLTDFWILPRIWDELPKDTEVFVTLLTGLGTGAAILAGFAGVLVIHGLTAHGPKFRMYRLKASKTLHANWASISGAGFTAFGVSFVAAILAATSLDWAAPWLMEFAILLTVHGVIRLLWMLKTIFKIQYEEDKLSPEASPEVDPFDNA